jgi:hypothetical protein
MVIAIASPGRYVALSGVAVRFMVFLVLFGWVPCPWQAAQVPEGKSAVV